jgi:hypothetical protein
MKSVCAMVFILWASSLLVAPTIGYAQPRTHRDRDNPQQWVSHQMNQPPPETGVKNNLSQERIEEIRQLYELAKREAEQRAKTAPNVTK